MAVKLGAKFALFDLDGCISDDGWRRARLPENATEPEEYSYYHEGLGGDEAMNRDLVLSELSKGHRIVFITARPMVYSKQTRHWIENHFPALGDSYCLLMREDDDLRPSPELKKHLMETNDIEPEEVAIAFDDRKDVVEMYRSLGIRGFILRKPEEAAAVSGVPAILRGMADTYEERNAVYKSNYKVCSEVMKALFPDGVSKEIAHSDVFGLFYMIVGKATRFAATGLSHKDSIHDIAVYAAIIESEMEK